jgi:hypothetical protein
VGGGVPNLRGVLRLNIEPGIDWGKKPTIGGTMV